MALTPKQKKLLDFLKAAELASRTFTLDEAAAETDYMPSAIKTYVSKKIGKGWVKKVQDGRYEVKGMAKMSEAGFGALMDQTAGSFPTHAAGFRAALAQLTRHAAAHGVDVVDVLWDQLELFERSCAPLKAA